MTRVALALPLLFALGACVDPLSGIARVSDGAPLPAEPGAQVVPSDDELAREGSILAGLFGRPAEDRVNETEGLDAATSADGAAVLSEDGVQPINETSPEVSGLAVDAGAEASLPNDVVTPARDADDTLVAANSEQITQPDAKTTGGLLGWLRQAAQSEKATQDAPVPVVLTEDENTDTADDIVPVVASNDLVEPEKRRGLFGAPRVQPRTGPDAVDVAPGMTVPFGQIARNCDAKPSRLGVVADKAARKGQGYVLYDTAPDSTGPRTFYVTGFSDNCPRQFTAALALFGEPAFHEQLRYGLPADEYPYSTTDQAYEKLKRRVCNVGRNTPCGDRIDRLSRTTTFISAYENFTDNARWADMLLHDGAVLAAALKTP